MEKIRLQKIALKHESEIKRIVKEYDKNNEDYNGAFFIKNISNYKDLIKNLDNCSKGIVDNPAYVPYTCYVAVTAKGKIIGVGSVRHTLNDYLLKYGGHVGYSVIPSERKKGYGTKILELLLKKAKKLKIDKMLITCYDKNIGSIRIIEANGGKLENKLEHDGNITFRYWIDIN